LQFISQLINGVSVGAVYALFAVGFSIVFSTMQILNLAQGVYATYGAMGTYWAMDKLHFPYWAGVLAGIVAGALIAMVVDQIAFEPLRRRGVQLLGAVVASIAAWIALREIVAIFTNSTPVGFPSTQVPSGRIMLGGNVDILDTQLIAVLCAVVAIGVVHLTLNHSRLGSAIRAVGYDKRAAVIAGISPQRMVMVAALISGGITGLAGIMLASGQSFDFTLGDGLLLQGFAAVVIGGMGDVRGAAIGGLFIGVVQTLSGSYLSNSYQDAITFGLVLAVLLLRPRGLLGTAAFQRV
jgi:branched-chain amino acid transport system permease protein